MDYKSVVERLFERHRSVQSAGFSADAYKPGLGQMLSYARALGDPHEAFRSIHVAGTNGKGTVCSMLAAAIASEGLRVGLYTSPHLLDFRERIKIISSGGVEMIPEETVCSFLDSYDRPGLSFFEITTGMAFRWFADSGVDIAVIETGLGGRLDSTNIITPELSVITSVGLDHCDLLGSTRALITAEKAGIFKPGVPALVWGRDQETEEVFRSAAAKGASPLYFAEDFDLPAAPAGLEGTEILNWKVALSALEILGHDGYSPAAVADYKKATGLRGRWEQLCDDPVVICDIGHNPQALEANFARLALLRFGRDRDGGTVAARDHVNGRGPRGSVGGMSGAKFRVPAPAEAQEGRPLIVVYGAMADKDVDSIASLLPPDAEYILVQPNTPRAMSLSDLALKLKSLNFTEQQSVAEGVCTALRRARDLHDPIIYIGGSTYVVSEAISYFESL